MAEVVPKTLVIQGKAKLNASVSMLYTDILSQELNAALGGPDAVALIQKHFRNRRLEQLRPQDIQPLVDTIPTGFFDVIKEASFAAGALSKELPCLREIKVGDPLFVEKSGLMAELEMKDARVQAIRSLKYKAKFESLEGE